MLILLNFQCCGPVSLVASFDRSVPSISASTDNVNMRLLMRFTLLKGRRLVVAGAYGKQKLRQSVIIIKKHCRLYFEQLSESKVWINKD